jgi:hypothetical protein
MTDSIGDLLDKSRFEEPFEVRTIKAFVQTKFNMTPTVSLQTAHIIIGVPNAALAGALRMHLHELSEACQTNKRLVIRIS